MYDLSLIIFAAGAVVFIVVCLGYWRFALARLKTEARIEYAERRKTKPRTVQSVSEQAFIAAYVASFQPRWAPYAAGAVGAALAFSPVALLAVPALYDMGWRSAGSPDWAGQGGYVYMFTLFFGMVFVWAAAASVVARLHHKRSPEPWNHALARARGEPINVDEARWRARPKWARRARPDPDGPADQGGVKRG